MVTPELVSYIKSELENGKTREEIHTTLIFDGGWTESDISEAFNTISKDGKVNLDPVPSGVLPQPIKNVIQKKHLTLLDEALFVVFAISLVLFWYVYEPNISNIWRAEVNQVIRLATEMPPIRFYIPNFGSKKSSSSIATKENIFVRKINTRVKDCGTTPTPDLNKSSTYENNIALNCLGESAINCDEAKATIKDDLFPTNFQITKNGDKCNFKLSYDVNSKLIDITGKALALEEISCPISVVLSFNDTAKIPVFTMPSVSNPSKYASQIYFYGTLGLFLENNVNKDKILALGCSGSYIDSVISSYQVMQNKK